MGDVSQEVRDLLDQHDWNDTIPRLIRFAMMKIRSMTWYQKKGGDVAVGKMAEDFVMDSIVKVYQGDRQWDPQKYPDLLGYLFGVLRSEIGHQSLSLENRSVLYMEGMSEYRKQKVASDAAKAKVPLTEEFLSGFIQYLGEERKLIDFVEHLTEGLKPRDAALKMGLPRDEIYNLRKVLKRRFEDYLEQLEKKNKD